jgi:nucleotide-binding universal stress UspA family protein
MIAPDAPVVYGYEGSPAATEAILQTAPLFAPREALIVTVYEAMLVYKVALPTVAAAPIDIRAAVEDDEAIYEHSRRLAADGVRLARKGGLDAEALAVADDVSTSSTLLRVADERHAAAIVVGSHGHTAVRALLLSSTTRDLLRAATRPVVVVRGPKGEGAV